MPVSVLVRMRRPTPWRNFRMASGRENSPKELPPRASIASSRASMSGWSGTANGSRVMMTLLNASPGTSTPCQKLSVPKSTESVSSLNFSSIVERGVPVPCTNTRAQLVEKRLHALAQLPHQLVIGEQHERLAMGLLHEMRDPMFERVGVTGFARVGHLFGDEQFHLPPVIERRADLKFRCRLGSDAFGEIIQSRLRFGICGQRRAGHDDSRVAFEKTAAQEISDIHRRGVERKVLCALPLRSTQ